ncbi:MAG: ferritin family protein [Pseudomonadota bacterium]
MTQVNTLEILKQAILLERRGHGFYKAVAEKAADPDVASFFDSMAAEEKKHMQVLGGQYKSYHETSRFASGAFDQGDLSQISASVLDGETRKKIAAAGFEAASIEAAIFMEQKAVDLYSRQAQAAVDPEEKKLYTWLAAWERQHLNQLAEINKSLIESIWNDNNFWPF